MTTSPLLKVLAILWSHAESYGQVGVAGLGNVG